MMNQSQKMITDLNNILRRNFGAIPDVSNAPEMRIHRMIYQSMRQVGMDEIFAAEVASSVKITITHQVWDDARAEVEELVGTLCEGIKAIWFSLLREHSPEVARVFMMNYNKEMFLKLEL